MNDAKGLFAERLKNAMLDAGYEARPVVLEREFNLRYWGQSVTFQAVQRWLRGESIPEQDKLLVLADWLGVDPQTLRFGPMSKDTQRQARKTTSDEEDILRAYRVLPIEQRKALREIIMGLVKSGK